MTRSSRAGNAVIKSVNYNKFYNPLHNESVFHLCFPQQDLAACSALHILIKWLLATRHHTGCIASEVFLNTVWYLTPADSWFREAEG